MALQLVPGTTAQSAGGYSGFIASSFMVGRTLSSYAWGKWADTYGRKPILVTSLLLSAIMSVVFGMSSSFAWALTSRLCLGLVNGLVGNCKTIVSELARGNGSLEKQGMGLAMSMWGWGFLISPAISGFLSAPAKQYPNNAWVIQNEEFFLQYPFILPNVFAAMMCITAATLLLFFVDETLPVEKRRSILQVPSDVSAWWSSVLSRCCFCFSCCCQHRRKEETYPLFAQQQRSAPVSIENNSKPTNSVNDVNNNTNDSGIKTSKDHRSIPKGSDDDETHDSGDRDTNTNQKTKKANGDGEASIRSIWQRAITRRHLLVYWMYSFGSMAVDEAFPLFCIGCLGLNEAGIGQILAVSGLMFGIAQYFVYAAVVGAFGVYKSILIGSFVSIPIVAILPIGGLLLPTVTAAFWWMAVVMALERIFGIVFFSSVSVAINHTVPATHRASMNGLSMVGGSVFKGIGPIAAGLLVSFCLSSGLFSLAVGGFVVFVVIALIGLSISLSSCWLLQEHAPGVED